MPANAGGCVLAVQCVLRVIGALVAGSLDRLRVLWSSFEDRQSMAAENLFLRKQLALFIDRGERPRRLSRVQRLALVQMSRLVRDWRQALVVVRPQTLIRWHREGFRLLWRWQSRRRGRPPVPGELQALITEMARDNPTWTARQVHKELLLKLGIRTSAETVRRYMPQRPDGRPGHGRARGDQRWTTFVQNHASSIVACDFLTVVTATFRVFYVFVVMEIGSRRILHCNVTASPTAAWTTQQLREAIPYDHRYRFLVHDRDSIFSTSLDETVRHLGLRVLKSPVRAPKANAFCERLIGTIRRECLDWLIPLNARHLLKILREWVGYYNHARPHSSLGPGFPDPAEGLPAALQPDRHRLPPGSRVTATPVLGGLCHDYRLDKAA